MAEAPAETGKAVVHEKTDVEPRAIVRFGIVLLVVTILVAAGLVYLFRTFAAMEARREPPPPPLAHLQPRLPPEPRLQQNPFVDYQQLREEEERILTHYAWVDQQAGVVQIQIDEAVTIVAQRLPARSDAAPAPAPGGDKK